MSTLSDPLGESKRPRTSSSGDDDDEEDLSKPRFSDGNIDKTMKRHLKEGGKDKESGKLNTLQFIRAVSIPQLPDPRSGNDFDDDTSEEKLNSPTLHSPDSPRNLPASPKNDLYEKVVKWMDFDHIQEISVVAL